MSDTARLLWAFADERVRAALTREFTEGLSRPQIDADRSGPGLWDGVLEIFLPQARGACPFGPQETIAP